MHAKLCEYCPEKQGLASKCTATLCPTKTNFASLSSQTAYGVLVAAVEGSIVLVARVGVPVVLAAGIEASSVGIPLVEVSIVC